MNPILAGMLASNLISNAVRHNVENGFIKISTINTTLTISNSGGSLKTETDHLFNRFTKGGSNHESVGLGLSIVKKIINYYDLSINYSYSNYTHEIKIDFENH
jgi:two-component system, OmpR family, sensor histidine kinase QseC